MKKKLISLLLVGVMVFSNAAMVSANDSHVYEAVESTKKSGAKALEAMDNGTGVIIDVRAAERQEDYSIKDTISLPLFTVENGSNKAINLQDGVDENGLEGAFNAYVEDAANKAVLSTKDIYILCNSGATGAKNATTLLVAAGYDINHIFTIENGAKSLDILDEAIGNDKTVWNETYQNFVAGHKALEDMNNDNVVVLDVRATAVRYTNGALKGSLAQPLFNYVDGANQVTTLYDDLAANFTAFVKGNADLAGKQIYVLCNGGQSGARAALKLLVNAGYSYNNIKVIQGGAGNSDVKAALVYVPVESTKRPGSEALNGVKDGSAVIIDVRAKERQADYNLGDKAISLPLFTVNANGGNVPTDLQDGVADELETAFNAYVKDEANKAALAGKKIYILCNSGATGAKNGTTLLAAAGYDITKIFTIENGAKDLAILDEAIGNDKTVWNETYQNFVAGDKALEDMNNDNVVILDVRATEVRNANGELKGSLAQPLFNYVNGKNVVTTLYDDLAVNFTTFVKGNKDLAGKQIYILCNGGQSGARAALKLLVNAGYSYNNIHVIKGGAGDVDVKAALVPVNTTGTVQTGDAATFVPYIIMMGAALVAIVVTSKKRVVK